MPEPLTPEGSLAGDDEDDDSDEDSDDESEEESDREGTKDFHALSNFYVVLGVD